MLMPLSCGAGGAGRLRVLRMNREFPILEKPLT